jgi:hypothetical protein
MSVQPVSCKGMHSKVEQAFRVLNTFIPKYSPGIFYQVCKRNWIVLFSLHIMSPLSLYKEGITNRGCDNLTIIKLGSIGVFKNCYV